MTSIIVQPPPAKFDITECVADLSTAQIRDIAKNLRAGYLGATPIPASAGVYLANRIERQVLARRTPKEVREWIIMWVTILGAIMQAMGLADHPAPQINQTVINNNTTIIQLPQPRP
jgi:hypothetical protein